MMNNLPSEIKYPICSFLDINQLGHLARVSKSWQKLANETSKEKLKNKQNVSYKLKLNNVLVNACEANACACAALHQNGYQFNFYYPEARFENMANTPLQMACILGHETIVALLLEHGASSILAIILMTALYNLSLILNPKKVIKRLSML